jgi:beta-lactam-binding protein with PASTA domain
MKKIILLLLLLALLMPATVTQAGNDKDKGDKKDEILPLGSRGNGVLCTDHFVRPERAASAVALELEQMSFPPYPYEDTFTLHSNPGNSHMLYLDVDGHTEYGETYEVWDPDGDGASFSDNEKLLIQKMWFLISEDYMPFNVDVTTEDPGAGFLGMRAVVDGGEMWGYGWAYVGTWGDGDNNIAYTGIWGNDWIYIAQAASHEVGHTLGCTDHGDNTTGYYMGHGEGATAWGVIMGWDSYGLGVWDDADYPNANHSDDSLAIITARPGAGYRSDDHASTHGAGATEMIFSGGGLELAAEGIIEQRTDVDYFRFTTLTSGNVQFSINEDVIIGISMTNLDVLAKIHDASGAVLYESNPLWDIWSSFDVTLPAGTYYLSIDGTGQDHPDGLPIEGFGYSDYGILGYYSIYASGAASGDPDVTPPAPDPMTFAVAPYATGETSIAMEATVATDTENGVEYYFTCLEDEDHDSLWQADTFYEDTGLVPETEYTYTVTARDTSGNFNETAPSSELSAITDDDTVVPTPDPMEWDIVPAAGGGGSAGISYDPISGDADSGISSDNTYTHAIDFGNQPAGGGVATVNGVIFADGGAGDFPAIGGSSQTVGTGSSTIPTPHNGDTAADAVLTDGGMRDLVHDMIYNDGTAVIQLTGLTPGQPYQFRLYHRSWGGTRPQDIGLDTDGVGTDITDAEDTAVFYEDDATQPDPSFATATQVYALTYNYTLSPGVTTLTVYSNQTGTGTYHLYGLTNQEAIGGDSDTSISMIATEATDPAGVEYNFTCVSGPGNDSGWQDSLVYTDMDLTSGTEYCYTVTARDKSAAGNATAASVIACAWTEGDPPPGDPVPDVVGMAQAAAEAAIVAAGFVVGTVDTEYNAGVPEGDVISQDPAAETPRPAGSSVDLVVSLGPEPPVDVPDVVGMSQAAAEAAITGANLIAIASTDYSATVPVGDVISQNPAGGTSVPQGSSVDIVVSLGIQVPDVVGISQAAAEAAIVAAGLTVGNVTTANSGTVPAGDVISQNPAAGAGAALGSAVDLVISDGPAPVTVPNVVGMTQAAAQAAITGASLIVGNVTTTYSPTVPAGDVISQNPAGGATVDQGTAVDLVVSDGPEPVTVPDVVGTAQAAAEAAIIAAGLTVGNVTTEYSPTVPIGDVISQNPSGGASALPGTPVDLVVSVDVPADVVTVTKAEYKADKDEFKVEATSSDQPAVTLTVVGFGEMTWKNDKYELKIKPLGVTPPCTVVVISSGGGSDSKATGANPCQDPGDPVPDVVGMSQAAAEAAIVAAGFTVGTVTTEYSGSVPVDDVISQDPAGGTSASPGSSVDLVVSLGPPPPVTVPDVVGLAQAAAEAAITGAGLTVGNVTTAYSPTVPAGDVISQAPTGGSSVAAGTAVDIVVSLGAEAIVPDVVGLAQAAAEAAITAANLTVGNVTTQNHASVPAGDVISQNPSSGTSVVEGSAVNLVVSDGPSSGDTVTIIKAEYKSDKSEFKVEATSSEGGSVTLTVVGYGTMTWKADKSKYEYKVKPVADPGATVTVTSSGGGQDTASVKH